MKQNEMIKNSFINFIEPLDMPKFALISKGSNSSYELFA